jgi:hypothetical protein
MRSFRAQFGEDCSGGGKQERGEVLRERLLSVDCTARTWHVHAPGSMLLLEQDAAILSRLRSSFFDVH